MTPSWIETANEKGTEFPIENLPYCVFSTKAQSQRIGVRIGDSMIDLKKLASEKLLPFQAELSQPILNGLMALSKPDRVEVREQICGLLQDEPNKLRDSNDLRSQVELDISDVYFHLPASIGDYTDFYASIFHATNVGAMFRPENPLLPNYRHLPVGYHGRASSIVISGTRIKRPNGQLSPGEGKANPTFGPSQRLDYELELGAFVAMGNDLGVPISINEAEDHVFGFCLLNDWSARDIQKWEYQPLGPFLGKSFATSVSPYVVTAEAMEPFRTAEVDRSSIPIPALEQDVTLGLLPYLDSKENQKQGGLDIRMEVFIQSTKMREKEQPPFKISDGNFKEMYWTVAQMLTHHASNGCNLRPGDLLGSGTVSGFEKTSRGCLLERNWQGDFEQPVSGSNRIPLEFPNGEKRDFLEDGDEVVFRGFAENSDGLQIGFGECRGVVK